MLTLKSIKSKITNAENTALFNEIETTYGLTGQLNLRTLMPGRNLQSI